MSDDHRGPYTPPSESPLTFDARRPERGGGGPAPVTLIVSVLVLLAVGGGAFYFYRNGARTPGQAPQPVGAPVTDVKSPAPPQAMPEDPAAGLSVYKDAPAGAAPAAPAFVPPPEAPASRAVADSPPPAPVAVTAAPVHAVAALPVDPVKAPTAKAAAALAPPAKPAAKTAAPAVVASAGGVASVQIGAYSSPALADKGWNDAAGVAPGAMAGKGKDVEPVSKGDTILYRASITGFATREAAVSLCDALKAAGKTCFVK